MNLNFQRKFIKFFCYKFKIEYKSENYEGLCSKLRLPLLADRRIFNDMTFLHKLINNGYECPLLLGKLSIRVPSYNSRNTDFFYVPFARINARKNSPLLRSMNEYNVILKEIEDIDFAMTEAMFRRCLGSYLYMTSYICGWN